MKSTQPTTKKLNNINELHKNSDIIELVISPGDKEMATLADSEDDPINIKFWNLEDMSEIRKDLIRDVLVGDVCYSNDGRLFAITCLITERLIVYECRTNKVVYEDYINTEAFRKRIKFAPCNRYIYVVEANKVEKLNLRNRNRDVFQDHPFELSCHSVDISGDGRYVFFTSGGGEESRVKILDTKKGVINAKAKLRFDEIVDSVKYIKKQNSIVFSKGKGEIVVYDMNDDRILTNQKAHDDYSVLSVSQDQKEMVSVSRDETICVWNVDTWEIKQKIKTNDGIKDAVKEDYQALCVDYKKDGSEFIVGFSKDSCGIARYTGINYNKEMKKKPTIMGIDI